MNRWQRYGVGCIVAGLVIGVLIYVTSLGSRASVNGVAVAASPTLFPPITLILLTVGVVLFLVGYLQKDKGAKRDE